MLGAGDKAGSGIDKIRAGWASEHWRSPSLRETHRPDRVVLSLPMVSTLPERVLDDLRRRFGSRFDALIGDEGQAMATAAIEGEVTNQRLHEMLTLHRVDITRMLRGLVREGLLAADGAGRGTRYRLPAAPPIGEATPPIGEATPPIGEATPPIGQALVARAARVRGAPRVSQQIMREVLLDLCADRFLTVQQLADLLGRDFAKLRDRHVRPLVEAGLLTLKFPERLNHPERAYRSVRRVDGEGLSS